MKFSLCLAILAAALAGVIAAPIRNKDRSSGEGTTAAPTRNKGVVATFSEGHENFIKTPLKIRIPLPAFAIPPGKGKQSDGSSVTRHSKDLKSYVRHERYPKGHSDLIIGGFKTEQEDVYIEDVAKDSKRTVTHTSYAGTNTHTAFEALEMPHQGPQNAPGSTSREEISHTTHPNGRETRRWNHFSERKSTTVEKYPPIQGDVTHDQNDTNDVPRERIDPYPPSQSPLRHAPTQDGDAHRKYIFVNNEYPPSQGHVTLSRQDTDSGKRTSIKTSVLHDGSKASVENNSGHFAHYLRNPDGELFLTDQHGNRIPGPAPHKVVTHMDITVR